MFRNIGPSTDKIYQWDFPKVAVLKRSTKGAMTLSIAFYQQGVSKNEIFKQFGVIADETFQ